MLGQWMIVGMIFAVCIALSFPLFAAIERITFALDDRKFRAWWRTYGAHLFDLRHRRRGAGTYCACATCQYDAHVRRYLRDHDACYLPPEKEG